MSSQLSPVDCMGRRLQPGDRVKFIDGKSARVRQVMANGRFVYGGDWTHPCIAVVKLAM